MEYRITSESADRPADLLAVGGQQEWCDATDAALAAAAAAYLAVHGMGHREVVITYNGPSSSGEIPELDALLEHVYEACCGSEPMLPARAADIGSRW